MIFGFILEGHSLAPLVKQKIIANEISLKDLFGRFCTIRGPEQITCPLTERHHMSTKMGTHGLGGHELVEFWPKVFAIHWIKCWLEVSWLLLHSVKDWDAEERIQTNKKLIQMILWLSSRMAENCKWHVCCRMSLLHRSIYHTESRAKIPKRGVLLRRLGHTHR